MVNDLLRHARTGTVDSDVSSHLGAHACKENIFGNDEGALQKVSET